LLKKGRWRQIRKRRSVASRSFTAKGDGFEDEDEDEQDGRWDWKRCMFERHLAFSSAPRWRVFSYEGRERILLRSCVISSLRGIVS
jgi:hypothetical protein